MSVLVPPRTHKLLESHINKFIATDESPDDFRTKVENIVDDQQSQNSFLLSAFSELLNQFVGSALDLLNFNDSRDTSRCKLAGLIVFDCLLDVNDDLHPERKFEIANHLCKILESDKSSDTVLRTAALSVGHFVRIASRTEVDHFGGIAFQLALKLVSDARSELHRFAGALIMSEISKNAPAFIFVRRQNIFTVIWDLVCDKSAKVRDAAAEALEAGLQVVSQREAMDDYLQQALHQINFGFQANTLEKNLSSLIILDIIVNGVVSTQDLQATIVAAELADDLIWKVLQRRDSRDEAVRQKVIEIIPNLADAFPINFVHINDFTGTDNFLTYCLNFLMGTIRAKRQRAAAYLSLGNLCLNMSNQLRAASITDDVVVVICEGFREPFCVEALESLGMIVCALPSVRRFVNDELVDSTFRGGLTPSLVECLKILSKYVPSVRDNVRSQLRVHISKILKKYTVLIDEVRGPTRVTQQLRLAKVAGRNPSLPGTASTPAPTPASRGSTMMRWGLTSAPKSESPVNLPPGTITAEEELIFALNLLTMTEFFPKQLQLTVRSRAGSNVSAATDDADQTVQLLLIARQSVVPYLDDYNPKLRSAASKACAAVLDCAVMAVEPSAIEYQYLLQILDRLLLMGVGDDSQEIRVCVFSSLNHSLDGVISYAESIHCLIEAINDESLEVRIAAIKVIARVAHHDTLHLMPVMRLTMKRLILTLLNSKDATVKRESVQLLQALINGAHHLIVPYVRQVIEPLMSLLNASSVDVVAALSTIGDLAVASPESVREHLAVLSPLLIEALNDTTSVSKQETAVIAMGKLVSSLTIEVTAQPYKRYEGLFEGLVRAIQSKDDSSSALRLQAIKTVGLLGIVDIHAFESYLTNIKTGQGEIGEQNENTELQEEDSDSDNETDAGDGIDAKLTRTEKAYFSVVTRELMKILRDSSLAHYHVTAATVAIRVLRILGQQAAQAPADLKELFSGVMHRIYLPDTPSNTRESLLDHILSIIVTVPHIIPENLDALVRLVRDFAETHLQVCLNLVEALSAASAKPHFYLVLKGVLPTLLAQLHAEVEVDSSLSLDEASFKRLSAKNIALPAALNSAVNRMKSSSNPFYRTSKILRLLNQIVEHLGEYRVDLIAVVIRIVDCGHATMDIRKDALCTVMFLANNVDLLEFASRIIHPLMRVVDKMDPSMQCTIVTALSSMVCRLGRGYIPYIIPVRRRLRFIALRESVSGPGKNRLEEYESLVNRLLKQRPLPPEPSDMSDLAVTRDEAVRSRTVTSRGAAENMLEFDLTSLETVWTLTERRSSSADLTEWMKRLNIELIRQSTSPIIRTCTSLATAYRPLAQGLFYIAFHCIWNELYAAEHHESFEENALIAGMETALRDPQSSKKYIAIPLLKLAEYMEMQDMPLSIDTVLLSNHAKRANMFAKCLYTREIEFSSKNFPPSNECIDSLIDVNNQLGLTDNAVGMLQYVRTHYPDISIQSEWLEKLCRWEDAKKSYDEERMQLFSQSIDSQDEFGKRSSGMPCSQAWVSSMLGKMRCLYALGEYEQLEECATALKNQIKGTVDVNADGFNPWDSMCEVQRLGAHATWMLGKWSAMEAFLEDEHDDDDGAVDVVLDQNVSFYRAIMAIHNKEYDRADLLISETRSELAGSIGSLLSEKYSRAYRALVTMQMLAEMEEIVDYKRYVDRAVASEKEASKNASNADLIVDAGHQRNGNQTGGGGPGVISPAALVPSVTSGKDPVSGTTAPPTTSAAAATAAMTMKLNDINAKKYNLILKWRGRLESAPKEVDVYRQILSVHTLVTEPTEDLDSWLDLVTLCRKERMHSLCENILRKLGAPLLQRKDSEVFGDAFLSNRDPSVPSRELSLKEQLEGAAIPGAPIASPTSPLSGRTNDRVMLSTFEYWWAIGEKARALSELTDYLKVVGVPHRLSSNTRRYSTTEATMFRVECLLKRADWNRELNTTEVSVKDTMATLLEARELAGDRYSVWHAWAVANYDWLKKADKADSNKPASEAEAGGSNGGSLATTNMPFSNGGPGAPVGTPPTTGTQYSKGKTNRASRKLGGNASQGSASLLSKLSSQQVDSVTPYIVEAIKGFVRSITLGHGQPIANVLQDTLRLITLWFSYGTKRGVFHILEGELECISPDHWLAVVPQLIARIHIKSPEISGLLRKLLSKVAVAHPQALVCPISVAMNTNDVQQREVAMQVLHEMRKSRSQLVEEATMVSRELMRVAITPHELWYDGLEQAAQLYMDSKDIHGMLAVLDGLHDAMAESTNGALSPVGSVQEGFSESMGKIGYTTLRDISFRHCYSKSIREAQHWLIQFKASMCTADLHQAWETYQQLFKRIKVQIVNLKKLELHHVSPALTSAADLSLAVPGTYKPGATDIGIKSFAHFIGVIASKQRPRRMSMLGSDGNRYEFLLKGHEDLRQDERVMQLFGLINACLNNDNLTNNRGLEIVRYSVLPLSNNSGVIGWVQNCDTINQLIKQYREAKEMRLLIEVKLLHAKCPYYDKLPVIHKVDLFRQVLEETTGKDLAKMLWLKSKTSDVWVERRANFTKSMAVMSMAGYILGLGDRHPSNLMLDRLSGRVVHIDFGDCFEITSQRAKFPEIVPFRLTRMLTNCMGPAGIQGSYRLTCERVMSVLRDNRDSVMAMLEAFVYDPLISWRLLATSDAAETAVPIASGNLRSHASMEDDSASKSSVEQLRVQMAAGSLLGGNAAAPTTMGAGAGSMLRNQSMRNQSMRDMKAQLAAGGAGAQDGEPLQENLNARALEVINRIQAKLTGRDFATNEDADDLTVEEQVERLIAEATSIENLCQLFTGWCPLW